MIWIIGWFVCGLIPGILFLRKAANSLGELDVGDLMQGLVVVLAGPISLHAWVFVYVDNHWDAVIWRRKDKK